MALSRHCSVTHDTVNKPALDEAYTVILVYKNRTTRFHSLKTCDDKCYHKRDVKINVQMMILPV